LIWATAENRAANWLVVTVAIAVTALVSIVLFGSYLVGSRERLVSFAHFLTDNVNRLVKKITFGRRPAVMKTAKTERFFIDFHEDFIVLKADKKLLLKPIVWGFLFTIFEVSVFMAAFWSMGNFVNPAILLIAYGAATLSGMFMLTPGGVGAYEAIMIGILTAGGVDAGVAFAGVIVARVILLVGTIGSGFVVYQHALRKYGQPDWDKKVDLAPEAEVERAEKEEKEIKD